MLDNLQEQFIEKLSEKYGHWERSTSRFGSTNFGEISADLCISASQFSKLISGTATEGMYTRSLRNVDRLIREESLALALDQALIDHQNTEIGQTKFRARLRLHPVFWYLGIFFFLAVLSIILFRWGAVKALFSFPKPEVENRQHPLAIFFDQAFDAPFDSPYLKVSEIQDYCPCSAYEGRWSLAQEYKLPLPGTGKPGVYYQAKSGDVRLKCAKSDTLTAPKGRVLNGYEYLINEIWVDTEQTPLSPRFFNKAEKTFTAEFEEMDFSEEPQFKKVATIHSFFVDKFIINDDYIVRIGEPCGRYAEDINEGLVAEYEIDLKYILEDVLGDLVKTNCAPMPNLYCDPNTLQAGASVISFDCLYTIQSENLGLGGGYPYTKGFLLEQQAYSDNLLCVCDRVD